MADQLLIVQPRLEANTATATPLDGGTITFFRSGNTNLAEVFTDEGLAIAAANPITADAAGRFPELFCSGAYDIRAVIRDSDGVLIETIDPCFSIPTSAGRSWQDVSSQRTTSQAYQNTTGRDIDVSIVGVSAEASVEVSVNGSSWVVVGYTSESAVKTAVYFSVPSNSYYRVNGSTTISVWSENR